MTGVNYNLQKYDTGQSRKDGKNVRVGFATRVETTKRLQRRRNKYIFLLLHF